jgi:hypothetical protein
MSEGSIGPVDRYVRPTNTVERSGSATDRRPRREQQDQKEAADRRRKEPPNPRRRRVYEMLFDEIDQIDSLSEQQRARVKDNIRSHVVAAPPPPPPEDPTPAPAEAPPPEHDEEHAAEQLLADPHAAVPVDHDQIVGVAAPVHPHQTLSEAEENRLLAEQLRVCLAQHTERARKLAVYLHMLLRMSGTLRPNMMLDV